MIKRSLNQSLFNALVALLFMLACQVTASAACTGSSPNYSAPDTGNATTNGSNLQACITAAAGVTNAAITITLTAGAEYRGNIVIQANSAGSSYISIQSSAAGSLPDGTRVSPSSISNMAKITTPNGNLAIQFNADTHHWKLIGIAVTTAFSYPSGQNTPFLISGDSTPGNITYGHWPDHISFERCLIYASEQDPLPYRSANRGIVLDGSNITIKDSYIYNFMGWDYPTTIMSITAATNANPVQVTWSAGTGYPNSNGTNTLGTFLVYLTGATGNWTPLNGLKVATYVDSTHATLQDYDSSFNLTNINSSGYGSFAGQTINRLSQSISTSIPITLSIGPGPYTIQNNFLEGYYSAMFSGGAGGTWIDPQNSQTVTAVTDLTHVTLSGVGQLQVGDLIAFSTLQDQSISGATAGTTTSITVPTMTYPAGTNLYPEGCVTISGFTGSWAPLNGNWGGQGNAAGTRCSGASGTVSVIDSTHLSIPLNSTGFGAVTSSSPKWVATIKDNSGATQWSVGKVTAISGNNITYTWWGHQPDNTGGNGAGLLVAVGASAIFRGRNIDGLQVLNNTMSIRRSWIWTIRDIAKTCDNCSSQPPKAVWESKVSDNVTINGNIFQIEGGGLEPKMGQVALAVNQANQIGSSPWLTNNNWTVTNNIFYNYTYQIMSLVEEYETGQVSSGLNFSNNLLLPSKGSFISINGGSNVTINHNTVRNLGGGVGYNSFLVVQSATTSTTVKDNIANWVLYGFQDFSGTWSPTQNHNHMIDNDSQSFTPGAGDVYVANDAAMGFTNITACDSGSDYHGCQLTSGSTYHNAASDGTDPGVNFTTLDAALGGGGGGGGGPIAGPSVKLIAICISIIMTFLLFGAVQAILFAQSQSQIALNAPASKYQSVIGPDRRKRLREMREATYQPKTKAKDYIRRED